MSYIVNADGSLRLDSLGRRIHINQSAGRPSHEMKEYVMVRMDSDMKLELALTAKRKGVTMSKLVRDYIEWGMENDS